MRNQIFHFVFSFFFACQLVSAEGGLRSARRELGIVDEVGLRDEWRVASEYEKDLMIITGAWVIALAASIAIAPIWACRAQHSYFSEIAVSAGRWVAAVSAFAAFAVVCVSVTALFEPIFDNLL